tara:strand:+ start:995 stop:1603 length:609 start_codon:yes stop_codon:yes gene_type:complete
LGKKEQGGMNMTKDKMTECDRKWGDGSNNAEWIRRLDVVLGDQRVTKQPRVKRRLQSVRRYAVKAEQARADHFRICMEGGNLLDGIPFPKKGLGIPSTHFSLKTNGEKLLCKMNGNDPSGCCPFCRDDALYCGTYLKLTHEPRAKVWADLTHDTHNNADFSNEATQQASSDCVSYALLRNFLTMKDDSYYIIANGQFIEVKT